jgi:hypothetical protein
MIPITGFIILYSEVNSSIALIAIRSDREEILSPVFLIINTIKLWQFILRKSLGVTLT